MSLNDCKLCPWSIQTPWVHLPVTMGYDRAPEQLLNEKKVLLEILLDENGRLFYTHDPKVALSRVAQDEKGKFSAVDEVFDMVGLEE